MVFRSTQSLVADLIAAGDTQADIAAATGLTQPTISRIYAGEHKNPSVDTHNRIASYAKKRLRRKATG